MWFGTNNKRQLISVGQLTLQQAIVLCAAVTLRLCVWCLPNGSRMKDGTLQQFARVTCAVFVLLVLISDLWPRYVLDNTATFFSRYVGPASAQSLALMRASCSFLLLIFTSDRMTPPLAATAQVPRWMCRPTGLIRVLDSGGALGGLFSDPSALQRLEKLTRVLLGCVAVGLATPVTAPCAVIFWFFYGGVLRAYNTWRGHSFITAWWGLVVIAWRGGAADAASLDKCLLATYAWWSSAWTRRPRSVSSVCPAEVTRTADRGWTRFIVTLIFANNYFMAGLSKLSASGVAWAYGENLKAKLLQTTLVQTSFGCYLTLFCRQFPGSFFSVLGACGLYGELVMVLVPFCSCTSFVLPIFMWGMHLGIAALQHIVFVDLLCFIPAWYLWHALDYASWDRWREFMRCRSWRQVLTCQNVRTMPIRGHIPVLASGQKTENKKEVRNATRTSIFMLVFLCFWAHGAEWFPYNSFRMFAGWTPRPIFYERYVALNSHGSRMRNFHYHEINPVLNRKRLLEALNLCAEEPESVDCITFLDFIIPRSVRMRDQPSALVIQTRSWDFVNNIDKQHYCDTMDIVILDIELRTVTKQKNLPCDALDLRACCASTLGTI